MGLVTNEVTHIVVKQTVKHLVAYRATHGIVRDLVRLRSGRISSYAYKENE